MENEVAVPDSWVLEAWRDLGAAALDMPIKDVERVGGAGKIRVVLMFVALVADLHKNIMIADEHVQERMPDDIGEWQTLQAIRALEMQGLITARGQTGQPTLYHLEIGN